MPLITTRFYEYELICDKCGRTRILHNVDEINGERVSSDNIKRLAHYHMKKGLLLCDECYKKGH
jgi:hypothetical protein